MTALTSIVRVTTRFTVAASILAAAVGCSKLGSNADAAVVTSDGAATASRQVTGDTTDLSRRPFILYQVFGERDDPRLLPVAALADGQIRPLVLSAEGWQRFDSLYHQPGAQYTIYQDGREAGWARVTRPMWNDRGEPLYSLPRCRSLTPLAAALVKSPPPVGYLVEHLATNAPLGTSDRRAAVRHASGDGNVGEARRVAASVAEASGMGPGVLSDLDFRTVAVAAGATDAPTLVASFIDPTAGATGATGHATHLFVLADQVGGRYMPTYSRIVRSSSTRTDYRRYVDHLDLTGDGVDELILEGWSSGHESYMLVLQYVEGRWTEAFQGRPSWCLDRG
ncbi:MAG: hypothetical protein ACYC2G_03300 [Gemmatimonadaceae bacterium]